MILGTLSRYSVDDGMLISCVPWDTVAIVQGTGRHYGTVMLSRWNRGVIVTTLPFLGNNTDPKLIEMRALGTGTRLVLGRAPNIG